MYKRYDQAWRKAIQDFDEDVDVYIQQIVESIKV
jgi:hypothetical protein